MGQGQDKIARNLLDLQPTAIVELFLLYFNTVDKETAFIAFHGGAIYNKGITWQGIEYLPIPVETEGFEVHADGTMARPKMRISNKDYFITDLLNNNQDLQFAKVIRKRTFVKYLDDVNFDGGNPWGDADSSAEISNDTYVISQKTTENKVFVEFELTSPLDLENFEVNNRLVMSRYCGWYYRGNGCNYQGPPLQTEDGRNIVMNAESILNWASLQSDAEWQTGKFYSSGDPVYLQNKKIIINASPDGTVPSGFAKIWYVCQSGHLSSYDKQPDLNQTYWTRDGCTKQLKACRLRFQNTPVQSLSSINIYFTNFFVNFAKISESGLVKNSIADNASLITASTFYGPTHKVDFAVDYKTGSRANDKGVVNVEWATKLKDVPRLYFEFQEKQNINKIKLFPRATKSNVFHVQSGRVFLYDTPDYGTGGRFSIVLGSYSWEQARNDAITRGGRLAVLNTAAKAAAVPAHSQNLWIGATDVAAQGIWRWEDGSLLKDGYQNWFPGEPNNAGGNQHYLGRFGSALSPTYQWGDYPITYTTTPSAIGGYILETPTGNFITGINFSGVGTFISGEDFRTLTFPTRSVKSVLISGYSDIYEVGLGEVQIFKPSGLGLYNTSISDSGVFESQDWHVATWMQFPSGAAKFFPQQKIDILHNVRRNTKTENNQHAGINLYIESTGTNPEVVLDFATIMRVGDEGSLQKTTSSVITNNRLKYSEEFDQSVWSKSGTSVTKNIAIAPNGQLEADALVELNTINKVKDVQSQHVINQNYKAAATTKHTFSIFVQPRSRSEVILGYWANNSEYNWNRYNLRGNGSTVNYAQNGSVITSKSASIEKYGNWYLCTFSADVPLNTGFNIDIKLSPGTTDLSTVPGAVPNSPFYIGNDATGIYLWGAQLQTGTSLVPYLPSTYFKNRIAERQIRLPIDDKILQPIHIECVGGKTSGLVPNYPYQDGYIRMIIGSGEARYALKPLSSPDILGQTITTKVTGALATLFGIDSITTKVGAFSGEWFAFKNPSYTGSTGPVFLGVNNWQYVTGYLESDGFVSENYDITSNLLLGTTAVWTGAASQERIDFFNRKDILTAYFNQELKAAQPRKYEELIEETNMTITGGLFAWWDMEMTGPPYQIEAENDSSKIIYLSGEYSTGVESTNTVAYTDIGGRINQTPKDYLPFGGFPGTDKYSQ
jgi:lambda family phage minor tail protein L